MLPYVMALSSMTADCNRRKDQSFTGISTMVQATVDRSHCVPLENGFIARVFPSRLNNRWCFNLLKDGRVVGGNVGFINKADAIKEAELIAERNAVRSRGWRQSS